MTIKNWPLYFALFLGKLIAYLPYSWIKRFGVLLGAIMNRFANSRKAIAKKNIELCFPNFSPIKQQELVHANLISTGIGLLETTMLWLGPERNWKAITEIEGLKYLEQAKNAGTGGLLLSFHLTSLEIGGCLLGKQFPIAALYRKNEQELLERVMTQGRSRFVHPIPRENTREMIKWIKSNGFVWYAADQDYGRAQSVFVPFFDVSAATITATSRFVKLTKAPVIPMTQERVGNKVKITIHPPIKIGGTNENEDALLINQFLESYLINAPEHYLWVHRRFKTRPSENEASLYPKKKKSRPVTPNRYRDIIDSAIDIEYEHEMPTWLRNSAHLIIFVYLDKPWFKFEHPKLQDSINANLSRTINGTEYRFKGLVRYCESKRCYLIYLE